MGSTSVSYDCDTASMSDLRGTVIQSADFSMGFEPSVICEIKITAAVRKDAGEG
jgi:hypothetical protein